MGRQCFVSALALLLILGAYGAGCFDSKRTKVEKWLKFHHLAPLPHSATNLMYYQWNGLFTGETYMRIELSSNDILAFIADSPGLAQGKKEIFSEKRQYLPYPKSIDPVSGDHSHFHKHRNFPDWFDPTITNHGVRFVIPQGPNSEIIINRHTSTVYLRSIKG